IAPGGCHRQSGGRPLAMVESPDGRWLVGTTNGYAKPAVAVFDLEHEYLRDAVVLDHAWLGLAWHPDGKRLYVSGAGNTTVHEMRLNERRTSARDPDEPSARPEEPRLTRGPDLVLGRPMEPPAQGSNRPEPVPQSC